MNRDSLHLTHWYHGWLRDDDVDPENQSSLMADLRAFIRDPFGKETFASTIPFRIIGHVTDHPKFPNEDIATSFVKEIRRVASNGATPAFDVVTLKSVYHISMRKIAMLLAVCVTLIWK